MTKLTPMHVRKTKGKVGGSRPGAGPKRKLDKASTPKVYIDQARKDGYTALGDGNFSLGIRRAYDLLVSHGLAPVIESR